MVRRHALWLVLVCAACLGAATDEKSYDVRIERPFKAGQAFSLSATDTIRSTQKTEITGGNGGTMGSVRRVIMDADLTVDKVTDKGRIDAATLVIQRLTLQTASEDASLAAVVRPVLAAGTTVLVTYAGDKPSFALNGKDELSLDAQGALLQGLKRVSLSDAVHGTSEKKKVGEDWPIHKEAMERDPQIDPDNISGTVTLKGVRDLAGVPCAQVEGKIAIRGFLVQGIQPREAAMNSSFSLMLPVDTGRPVAAWIAKSTTHFVVDQKRQDGRTVTSTVDSEVSHEATWTEKPAGTSK